MNAKLRDILGSAGLSLIVTPKHRSNGNGRHPEGRKRSGEESASRSASRDRATALR
jgi:hypothetical protein